jgi:hypothetical protein
MQVEADKLWLLLERLAGDRLPYLTLMPEDARLVLREVSALQRIVREMGTGEALLVRDVYEHFDDLRR